MNEAPGAEGIEVPQGGPSMDSGGGTKTLLVAMIAVLVLAFQLVSSHLIVKMLFFNNKAETVQKEEEKAAKPEPPGEIYRMESILVNPTATRGRQHLLVELGLEVDSPEVITELTTLDPLLRDNIITVLSAQPMDVLTNIMMRDKIKQRIQDIVNYYLSKGKVTKVYFIRYVFP